VGLRFAAHSLPKISSKENPNWLSGFPQYSSTAPSNPTRVDRSISLAEPDVAWVAERQSAITASFEHKDNEGRQQNLGDEEFPSGHLSHPSPEDRAREAEQSDSQTVRQSFVRRKGANGKGNLSENVPFGEHQGYV
jgi:hypothetical protein